ncbi:MAG TPA: hypothetical protein VFJ06_01425, partial [Halococcus sp.]|nr:hypothetical protein [Halococcus sp.]
SIEGREAIAEVDRRFAQQRPQIQQTVRAVEDLGLDPSGGTSVSGTLESELSGMANTRIVFPGDGTFLLSEQVTAQPDGPIEFVGNGCSFVIPPNTEMRSFVFVLPSGSLINNIVIDQSATGAIQEFSVQTEGVVRADNVTVKGYIPAHTSSSNIDATFSPIARTEGAVVRATNYTAVGGTAAGIHDEADLPPSAPENRLGGSIGIWVGQSTKGTIQLVNPTLSGWSNGIYGGRTTGRVEVRGGTFVNNWNCQTRIGGGSVVDGASMLLDDRQWSDKGPFKIGHQGVYAARVDAKHGNTTDPARFVNLDVRAMSMREGASLFDWESVSGPGIIQNCRITNHLDRPVILGESPSVSGPTNIMVDQCLITGSSSGTVMECHDRPQSRVQWTCIQLPDAGPEDIQGAQIGQGVSFGPQCMTGSGLAAPKKVGSGGNISSLPAPTNPSGPSGPGPDNPAREGPSKGVFVAVIDGIFMVLLLLLGMVVLFVAGILGALGALAGMIGGD